LLLWHLAVADDDVENDALLIDGAPQIVLHSLDPDEHSSRYHVSPGRGRRRRRRPAKVWPNFLHPPDRLMGGDNASFSQEQLDIP
jgi:hypothetical protein